MTLHHSLHHSLHRNPPHIPPGGQAFADVHLNPDTRAPVVSVLGSSGFCPVVDKSSHREELDQLSLDYVVRFTLHTITDQFDSGQRTDDDGLREQHLCTMLLPTML